MKKFACVFILVLSMFLIYTIPAYGELFLKLDQSDPVDEQYTLTPGLALNAELGASIPSFLMVFDGAWTFNDNLGIKGAFIYRTVDYNAENLFMGINLFGKVGSFYGEIGPQVASGIGIMLHTGLNGFFPQIGRSGPTFENSFDICLNPDYIFNGLLKGGWMWLFGNHSHLLIGGLCNYRLGLGVLTIEPYPGLVEISVDDKVGPFLFDGKVQLALINGVSAEANISVAYMPINWMGLA